MKHGMMHYPAGGGSKMPTPKANIQHQGGTIQAPAALPKPKANIQHNHGHGGGMKKGY